MDRVRVVGYVDRLSVVPGETLRLMVSCEAPSFVADVVRLRHGDTSPDGPGPRSRTVREAVGGTLPGRVQPLHAGSHIVVARARPLAAGAGMTVSAWIWPTLPERGAQAIVTQLDRDGRGIALGLDEHGRVELAIADGADRRTQVASRRPVCARVWHFVAATFDAASGVAAVSVFAEGRGLWAPVEDRHEEIVGDIALPDGEVPILIGAARSADGHGAAFDGKIELPAVHDRALDLDALERWRTTADVDGLVSAWDLSIGISGRDVHDIGPAAQHGRVVNQPARAVTGHAWDGGEVDWRRAREQYGAIHLHSDDLDDAGWEPDLEWRVPAEMPSGIYAFRLRAEDGSEDDVPFVVRPPRGGPTARVALVLPTLTYLAYGNEQQLGRDEIRRVFEGLGASFTYPLQPADRYVVEHGLLSCYDRHRDGSGVMYSSRLRPVLSMRPAYRFPYLLQGRGAPHGLGADLHLVDWLMEEGHDVDVVTDEDLHHEGVELLSRYRVVLSGSHHEYWTAPMLQALDAYLAGGGRFMYLSGNGLYWVTGLDPEAGHTIEVRRCGPSTRTWEASPGEWHSSFTGELGGLWRFRGRAPQRFVGVGFTAEGLGRGRPYRRTAAARDPRADFIFEGLGDDELVGDTPSLVLGYGAAGWEIDRHDEALGSPPHALVVATADGFTDEYQHAVDEVLHADSRQGGSVDPAVRADMVFFECPNGGAVFSVGSIGWCGALSFNGYDNAVARVTGNVLRRFAADAAFELPDGAATITAGDRASGG